MVFRALPPLRGYTPCRRGPLPANRWNRTWPVVNLPIWRSIRELPGSRID